ncbi:MAG TPA: DUF5615 family PIN-like protein [Thermomicrobiales bacterium]|nr:DUF5615 family PIN-like protein [Thermomicrobiales bacterium]
MARFHLDHNVSMALTALLRAAGHDTVTAGDLGLQRADDDVHLAEAAEAGRIFVTHNRTDFVLLHRAWHRWSRRWGVHRPHAGILVIPQAPHLQPAQAAVEVEGIVRQAPISGELYIYDWQAGTGWRREPAP